MTHYLYSKLRGLLSFSSDIIQANFFLESGESTFLQEKLNALIISIPVIDPLNKEQEPQYIKDLYNVSFSKKDLIKLFETC